MELSKRQQDIDSHWQNADGNIVIKAVAGSGKTTMLMELLKKCRKRTLFVAFNKSIKEEISQRIETLGLKQGKAMTLHALGLLAIRSKYRFKVVSGKNFTLIKKLQKTKEFKSTFNKLLWQEKLALSYTLMDINDISRLFLTDDLVEIKKHLSSMDKGSFWHKRLPDMWDKFIELREASYKGKFIEIDFHDMIYLPVKQGLKIGLNPTYLFIDEAQDLNLCQHKLLDLLIQEASVKRWIAVGDPHQSIYGFSGAYSTSFDRFLQKPNTVEMPLDICYRCSTNIIDSANEVFDIMQYSSPDEGIVEVESNIADVKQNSMVVCRNSGPLISLYFNLIGLNKPVYIKGKDILTTLLRFLKPYEKCTTNLAKTEMLYKMEDLNKENTEESRIALFKFRENFANYKLLYEHLCSGSESVADLVSKVKKLFVQKENAITLCTIHKSKGLESDVVYILNEHLIPSKFARSPEQLKQEQNLKYVARTRAKKELYFINI